MKVGRAAAARPAARLMRVAAASPPTAIGRRVWSLRRHKPAKGAVAVVVESVRGALRGGVGWRGNRRGGGNIIGE
jgi:hypothetical protein